MTRTKLLLEIFAILSDPAPTRKADHAKQVKVKEWIAKHGAEIKKMRGEKHESKDAEKSN